MVQTYGSGDLGQTVYASDLFFRTSKNELTKSVTLTDFIQQA